VINKCIEKLGLSLLVVGQYERLLSQLEADVAPMHVQKSGGGALD
jgi:hypothetical protein